MQSSPRSVLPLLYLKANTSMTASLSEAKSELTVVSGDRERLREAHARDRAENDQLRKKVELSKKSIATLRER